MSQSTVTSANTAHNDVRSVREEPTTTSVEARQVLPASPPPPAPPRAKHADAWQATLPTTAPAAPVQPLPVSPRLAHASLSEDLSVSELTFSRSVSPTTPRRVVTARDWARGTSPAKEPRSASLSRRDSFAASFASAIGSVDGAQSAQGDPEAAISCRRFRRVISPRARPLGAVLSAAALSGSDSPPPLLVGQTPPRTAHGVASPPSARFHPFQPFHLPVPHNGNDGGDTGSVEDCSAEVLSCQTSMSWVAGGAGTNSLTSSRAFANASPQVALSTPLTPAPSALQYTAQERRLLEENEGGFYLDHHTGETPVPMAPDDVHHSDWHTFAMTNTGGPGAACRSNSPSRCSQSFSTLFRRESSVGSFAFGEAATGGEHGYGGRTPLAWPRTSATDSPSSSPCYRDLGTAGGLSPRAGPGLETLSRHSSLNSLSGRASPSAMASAATMLAHAAARAAHQQDQDATTAALTSDADVVVKRHRIESDLDVISRALSSAPSSQLVEADGPYAPLSSARGSGGAVSPFSASSSSFVSGGLLPYPGVLRRRQASPSVARPMDEETDDVVCDSRSRSGSASRGARHTRRAVREASLPPPPHCDETPQPSQCQHRYRAGGHDDRTELSQDPHAPPPCRVVDFSATDAPLLSTGRPPRGAPLDGRLLPRSDPAEPEPPCRLSGLSACSADSDEPQIDQAGLLRHELAAEDADSMVMQEQEARRMRQHLTATSQHARDLLARGDEDSIHLLAELVEEAGRDSTVAVPSTRQPSAMPCAQPSSSSTTPRTVVDVSSPLSPSFHEWCRATPTTPSGSGFRDLSPPLRERSMAPHEVMREWRRHTAGS